MFNKQVTSKHYAMTISSSFDVHNIYGLLNTQSATTREHYDGYTNIPR
jgi:hypothetical protein